MKKFLLWIGCLLSFLSNAQSPKFEWAKGMGGSGSAIGYSIAVDGGNIYTTGKFRFTVDFNPDFKDSLNLTTHGQSDVFISKLDESGNFVWAKSIGGANDDIGYSILVDESGNIYIAGTFNGTVDFDMGQDTFNMTSANENNIFILKLDNNGNFIWAKTIGGTTSEFGKLAIVLDASNNIYITGHFDGISDFDPDIALNYNLTSSGKSDIFISKLDVDGNFVWAKKMGGILYDESHSIALGNSGEIYITGVFQGTVDFNPDSISINNLISKAGGDMFIAKFDNEGNLVWAKNVGGTLWTIPNSMIVDELGNIYTIGTFYGTTDFNPDLEVSNLTASGFCDIFISKYNKLGKFVWAKNIGDTFYDQGYSIGYDRFGYIYSLQVTGIGSRDGAMEVSKMDTSGKILWSQKIVKTNQPLGYSITLDSRKNIYVTGLFGGTVDFDPSQEVFNLSASVQDIFILKLNQTTLGIKDNGAINKIKIYPNPTNNFISIDIPKQISKANVEVYNSIGVMVYHQSIVKGQDIIDLSNQANSIYFIKVVSGDKIIATQRIIKH